MTVAQLIETLDAGGAEALAVDIANALAARGIDSHLIVINGGGRFQGRVHEEVTLHDLDAPRSTGRFLSRAFYFGRIHRVLAGVVRAHGISVIQSHLPKANFFGLTLAMRKLARVHPTVHNNREFDYGDNPSLAIEKGRRMGYRWMLRFNAEMIAVSREVGVAMAEELGVSGTPAADRIVAIPNGVTCPDLPTSAARRETRAAWGVSDDEVLLVTAGRLTRQKDFGTLIAALRSLPGDLPSWKCIIGGEGEERALLEARISEAGLKGRVLMPGHVAGLRDLMAAADVFCLSSLFEGLPLTMLEAMSTGLPVCAFGIPGVTDVLTQGREGLLADPGDVDGFEGQCVRLIGDVALRVELGRRGRALVKKSYGFDRQVDELIDLYSG